MNNDDYIDDNFECAWRQSVEIEKQEIARVGEVIQGFVGEMARRRKNWKAEYDQLHQEFGSTTGLSMILNPFRLKRYHRYQNLERILGDLPERESFATRDVHRKTHGCVAGTFKVREDLESDLAKGLFQPGAVYDAVVRFSSGNPRALEDYTPDSRGMAVKLLPQGTLPHDDDPKAIVKQWLGSHQGQQVDPIVLNRNGLLDILAVNFPVFFLNNPSLYRDVNHAFLKVTNDEDAVLEHLLSSLKAGFFSGLNVWERELVFNASSSIIYNPLYQKYYSMAASRLGKKSDPERQAVKYLWEPCRSGRYDELVKTNNPVWADLREYAHPILGIIEKWRHPIPAEVKKTRNHLRNMLAVSLSPLVFEQDPSRPPACFELKVQKYIDQTHTPIEDTTAIWLESEAQRSYWLGKHKLPDREKNAVKSREIAPFQTIGTLTISPLPLAEIKPLDSEDRIPQTRNRGYCEDLSYNPWNNVPEEHRPLGVVQRMRREVYAASRNTRFKENQVPNVFC